MDNTRKKELARTYKEEKPKPGVYAVRCTATGQAWVAKSPDLRKRHTALWFQLNGGGFPGKTVQAAWTQHGEAAFVFEVVEEISDENELLIPVLLKDREAHWRKELGAAALI